MFKKLIMIIICIFFKYLYHAHIRDLRFQTKYLNSSRFKVCFLNFVGCLNMSKRNSSIPGHSNKYNQLPTEHSSMLNCWDKDNSKRTRKHWAKDFSLPLGSEREAGKREYEIGERRLVDTVSHAHQTKNDVYS